MVRQNFQTWLEKAMEIYFCDYCAVLGQAMEGWALFKRSLEFSLSLVVLVKIVGEPSNSTPSTLSLLKQSLHAPKFPFLNIILIFYVASWWVEILMSWTLVVKANRGDKVALSCVYFVKMFRNKIIKYLFYVLFQVLCKTNKSKLKENISISDFKYQRTGNSPSLIFHWDYSNLLFWNSLL